MNVHSCSFTTRVLRQGRRRVVAAIALVCVAAHAETQCPGYVETGAGSAFDLAGIIRDTGSPQLALERVRKAVSKVDAGGGCSIFSDTRACEETMTLAHKAIVALQTCSSTAPLKGTSHG